MRICPHAWCEGGGQERSEKGARHAARGGMVRSVTETLAGIQYWSPPLRPSPWRCGLWRKVAAAGAEHLCDEIRIELLAGRCNLEWIRGDELEHTTHLIHLDLPLQLGRAEDGSRHAKGSPVSQTAWE